MVDRPRCLIAGEWLVLEPLEGGARTRLIARTRGGWLEPLARKVPFIGPVLWPIAALIERGPGELLHHYMESGMLRGIKARAEASGPITRYLRLPPHERTRTGALIAPGGELGDTGRSSSRMARPPCILVRGTAVVPRRYLGLRTNATAEPTPVGGCRLLVRRGSGAHRRPRRLPRRADAGRVGRSRAVLRAPPATPCGEGRGPGARRRERRGDRCPCRETARAGGTRLAPGDRCGPVGVPAWGRGHSRSLGAASHAANLTTHNPWRFQLRRLESTCSPTER
jgi:hypothetical protein